MAGRHRRRAAQDAAWAVPAADAARDAVGEVAEDECTARAVALGPVVLQCTAARTVQAWEDGIAEDMFQHAEVRGGGGRALAVVG